MSCTTTSVDEFLMDCIHTQMYIEDFISSLDRPVSMSYSSRNEWTTFTTCESEPEDTRRIQVSVAGLNSLNSNAERCNVNFGGQSRKFQSATISMVGRIQKESGSSGKKLTHKFNKPKLSAQEREERRKIQNREAQRRYREKNMLIVYRKISAHVVSQQLFGHL